MNFAQTESRLSQVTSALAFMPTSLIEIVLDYSRSPVSSINYRCDRTVFAGSGLDIPTTGRALAVRMGDGSVTCWPHADSSVQARLKNVKAICGSRYAFAAIVGEDNSVICWGDSRSGGDCSSVARKLTQVEGICATDGAFTALKRDGTVVTWGNKRERRLSNNAGYEGISWADKDRGKISASVQRGVKAIYSTGSAFAAVLRDGTVEAWGEPDDGAWVPEKGRLLQVQCISGNLKAFAALLSDGTVVAWGDRRHGGNSPLVTNKLTEVELICATDRAFAALKKDGTVVTWGDKEYGGDSSKVQGELKQVVGLCAASCLFTAVRSDGCVVTWGRPGSLFFFSPSSASSSEGRVVTWQLEDVLERKSK